MTTSGWAWPAIAVAGVGGAYVAWKLLQPEALSEAFASSNGRIEAVEIAVATQSAGRLEAVLANEGDFVSAGQVLAKMDTDVLEAQLRAAEADLRRARAGVETSASTVSQRESEKSAADSIVAQRDAELDLAKKRLQRAERLSETSVIAVEELDTQRASYHGAKAAVDAAKANAARSDAAITAARSIVIEANAAVEASSAKIECLHVDIDHCSLKAPRDGRVQFRIAQPGEVLSAGGKVLELVDLADVYMTFFLPTAAAGRVRIGAEARLVFDAAPEYVVPAVVSFVADVAQFTPKMVETAEERQKLQFRIKARIDPNLLRQYVRSIKTGVPGMAYVRLDEQVEWPARLTVRLPIPP